MCRITRLSPAHLPEILEIERESFSDAWSEGMFAGLMASPHTFGFVAENPDKPDNPDKTGGIAGYIMFNLITSAPQEMQILNIAVRKSARNQQIGSLLLKSALGCAPISRATLEVRESNTPAISLYKKVGFKTDGARKNYYTRPKENAILMSLEI